jgi:hypothetical protein
LEVDECYTTVDQALKYTLIHLQKRVREKSIERMMGMMQAKFGIVQSNLVFSKAILSFDRRNADLELEDTVVIKWIARDRNLKQPWYEEWISEHRGKGILDTLLYIIGERKTTSLETTTKRQLARQLFVAEQKLEALADQTMDEYDVVKKQRIIQTASSLVGQDMSSVILGSEEAASYFQVFSSDVLTALQRLCIRELELRVEDEVANQQQCAGSKPRVGYVYGVGNSCLGTNMHKIGATFRDSPWPRIKELSKCLPTEFYIVSLVACTNPFEIEKKAHMHFADKRVWKEAIGRKTEFFLITEDELSNYFAELNQELVLGD